MIDSSQNNLKIRLSLPQTYPFVSPQVDFVNQSQHFVICPLTQELKESVMQQIWYALMDIDLFLQNLQNVLRASQNNPKYHSLCCPCCTREDAFREFWELLSH